MHQQRFILLLNKGEDPDGRGDLVAHRLRQIAPSHPVSITPSGDAWHDLAPYHGGNFKTWPDTLLGTGPDGCSRFDGAVVTTPRVGAGTAAVVRAFIEARRAVLYVDCAGTSAPVRVVATVRVSQSWQDGFELRVVPL